MEIIFEYDHNTRRTDETLEISLADLRDLIQAAGMTDRGEQIEEIQLILKHIENRNGWDRGAVSAVRVDNDD